MNVTAEPVFVDGQRRYSCMRVQAAATGFRDRRSTLRESDAAGYRRFSNAAAIG